MKTSYILSSGSTARGTAASESCPIWRILETGKAPNLVAANDKRSARIEILRTLCQRMQARLAEARAADKKKKKNRKNKK